MAAETAHHRMTRYVLDSFAILAYYWNEPNARRVEAILADPSHRRWMSVVNVGEVYYRAAKRIGAATDDTPIEVLDRLLGLNIEFVSADMTLTLDAARIKSRFPISYADSFVAALANLLQAKIVTGDPEFEPLEQEGIAEIEWLSPKPKRRR